MNREERNCQNCKSVFIIESDDFAFYAKIKVPPPTFCPECRMQRRLTFRNERSLYKRPCNACKEEKILMYPADSRYTVYCRTCWWSDHWDPRSYAREYNFSRSFFTQFDELIRAVPRVGIIQQGENPGSEYTNRVAENRNCYLTFGCTRTENSRYGVFLNDSKECIDCYNVQKSERCYGSIDCFQCANVLFAQESNECLDAAFLVNCRNCTNCFGCVNLRNKNYCAFNQQYTPEEYKKIVASYWERGRAGIDAARQALAELKKKLIVPSIVARHSEDVSGNWLEACKNTHASFGVHNAENVKYGFSIFQIKDCMDYCHWGNSSELIYDSVNVGVQSANIRFCSECFSQALDMTYCMNCHTSKNLFGCSGLRNAEYCILNKQYSKDEYAVLTKKIIAHMDTMPYKDDGGRVYKFGEFIPPALCPFAYNESIGQEFFPKSKEEANAAGYGWAESKEKNYAITLAGDTLPDNMQEIGDAVLNDVVGCAHKGACKEQCTTAFRITNEELQYYRMVKLPLPQLCPNCRHYERLAKRTPLKLWPRTCQCAGAASENKIYQNTATHFHGSNPCANVFQTSYAPDRPEIVYCEQCYQSEVV